MSENQKQEEPKAKEGEILNDDDLAGTPPLNLLGKILAVAGIVFSVIYILNPTAGFIELIPDNVPLIGNIDEAAITGLLLYCLRLLGFNPLGGRKHKHSQNADNKKQERNKS